MVGVARYAGLVLAILAGLVLGQEFGPADSLPAVSTIDDSFFDAMRNQTLFLGLSASLAACLANLALRITHFRVLVTLVITAALWLTWFQSAEPDFLTYLAGALAEFLAWIVIAAAPVVALFWLIDRNTGTRRKEAEH